MKKIYFAGLFMFMFFETMAQTNFNLGAGYYGQNVTYPGVVFNGELEKVFSEKVSMPIRADLGFYVQPRFATSLFLDVSVGSRKYFKSGIFIEESIGAGVLQTFVHSDGVFKVDEEGNVSEGSRANPVYFMPSISLGIGYDLEKNTGKRNLIWLRPKISWMVPDKTTSSYNVALQLGFTHTLSSKERYK